MGAGEGKGTEEVREGCGGEEVEEGEEGGDEAGFFVGYCTKGEGGGGYGQGENVQGLALDVAWEVGAAGARAQGLEEAEGGEGEGSGEEEREAFREIVVGSVLAVEDGEVLHDV